MKIKEYLKNNKNKALAYVLAFVLVIIAVVNLFVVNSSALSDCDKYGHYFSNGQCTVCGYGCNHQDRTCIIEVIPDTLQIDKHLLTEYCPECDSELSHTWEDCYFDGITSNLTPDCDGCHDPIISYGGEVETDTPTIPCTHFFVDGVCGLCNFICPHHYTSSSGGNCTLCDKKCTHLGCTFETRFDEISSLTYRYKYHVVHIVCTTCYQYNYDDSRNGAYESHVFKNSTCTVCGFVCNHINGYNTNGKCNSCGYACPHLSYSGGICTICSAPCSHSVAYRVVNQNNRLYHNVEKYCTKCNYVIAVSQAEHTFKSSKCTACWYVCTEHYLIFENGTTYCDDCDYSCKHLFSIGKCLRCGMNCDHVFKPNSASCSICYYVADTPTENDDTLAFNLITSIYDAQATTFLSLLNYNIFGINLAMVVGALIVLSITFVIVSKKVK